MLLEQLGVPVVSPASTDVTTRDQRVHLLVPLYGGYPVHQRGQRNHRQREGRHGGAGLLLVIGV